MEEAGLVLAPDHVLAHHDPVGVGGERPHRALHHRVQPRGRTVQRVHDAAVRVVRAAQADVLLLPDAVGAAQDVIDDVGVDGLEPVAERLAAGTFGQNLVQRAADGRQHLRTGVPGRLPGRIEHEAAHARSAPASTPTSSKIIHSSTITPPTKRMWVIPIISAGRPAGQSPKTPPRAVEPSSRQRTARITPSVSSDQETCSSSIVPSGMEVSTCRIRADRFRSPTATRPPPAWHTMSRP